MHACCGGADLEGTMSSCALASNQMALCLCSETPHFLSF